MDHESLADRIQSAPLEHLGGFSPTLLTSYYSGYDQALRFHGASAMKGRLSYWELRVWFRDHIYGGREGFESFCELLTNSEHDALALVYEFRKIRLNRLENGEQSDQVTSTDSATTSKGEEKLPLRDWVLHSAIHERPALYFANHPWVEQLWAWCSGFLWAEKDLRIESEDSIIFKDFQLWLDMKYPFAEGANWGKLMTFKGMNVNGNALKQFKDHFQTYLSGGAPNDPTLKTQEWIKGCLEDAMDRKARGEL